LHSTFRRRLAYPTYSEWNNAAIKGGWNGFNNMEFNVLGLLGLILI
jgi:hypothetical protein